MDSSVDEEDEDLLGTVSSRNNRRAGSSAPALLYLLTSLSVVGGFLFGYDTGVVSGAMVLVVREFQLSDTWHSILVSGTIFAAFVTSIFTGSFSDRFGRRPTILLASLMFLVGSLVMGLAPDKVVLLAGRLLVGVGVGLTSTTVPLYISECSPVEMRGELVTANNLAITGGQLVAGLTCGALSSQGGSWRWMLGLAALPSAVQLVGFSFMPESPRHLVSKERYREAEHVLCSVRGPYHQVQDELEDIKIACRQHNGGRSGNVWSRLIADRLARKALLVGCLLQAVQQLAGINTVMYYSASILEMAGAGPHLAIWLSAITAAVNFLFTLVGLKLVVAWKRRSLLFASLLLVVLSLLIIAASFQYMSLNSSVDQPGLTGPVLVLLSLCLYLVVFAPGLGPLPWTINSELHPAWCRAASVSLTTATNWASNLVVSLTFLSLTSTMGRPVAFLFYGLLTGIGSVILYVALPETKGVALEDVGALFGESRARSGIYTRVPFVAD